MKIALLGVPGSGKGTQAEFISKEYDIPSISVGEIYREEAVKDTEDSRKINEVMKKGELLPDILTMGLVEKRINKKDCKNGFILDGEPRTVGQADMLKNITELDYVLFIDIPEKLIVERISKRRVCSECGENYHLKYNPPKKDGICDKCGGKLEQRSDATEEAVKTRIQMFKELTFPLIERYKKEGILFKIDGTQSIGKVFEDIKEALNS